VYKRVEVMTTRRPYDSAVEAIQVLSRGVGADVAKADRWLVEFERSSEAWIVADELASDTSANSDIHTFWGAKFMYSKIQRDFHQLNGASIPSLASSLVQHILRLSQGKTVSIMVLRYFCLALAALTVQINADGTVKQILQWLDSIVTTQPRILLELLISLAEESGNRRIDVHPGTRESFCQQLTQTSGDVFGFLNFLATTTVASTPVPLSIELSQKILKCLERWIDNTSLPGHFLATHPIFTWSMSCLENEDLFVSSVDVIRAALEKFNLSDEIIYRTLLPRILSLKGVWMVQIEKLDIDPENEEAVKICRVISQLLYETSRSFDGMFLVESETASTFEILAFILECAKFNRYSLDIYPSGIETATFPVYFIQSLGTTIRRVSEEREEAILYIREEEDGEVEENYNLGFFRRGTDIKVISGSSAITRFAPFFHSVLEIIMHMCVIPDPKILCGEREFPEELFDAREIWRRTVEICVDIVGAEECAKLLCVNLSNTMSVTTSSIDWAKVESILFCLQMVTKWLPSNDSTYMPKLVAFFPHLPNSRILKTTSVELIGNVSDWLVNNPQFIGPIFTQLGGDLSNDACVLPAAETLSKLFIKCSTKGVTSSLPLREIHDLTLILRERGTGALPLKADELILEGLGVAVHAMPPQEHRAALQTLIEPIVKSLSQKLVLTGDGVGGGGSELIQAIKSDIDRCTVILRNSPNGAVRGSTKMAERDPEAITSIFVSIQPLLQNALERYPSIESVAERVCRCYKHTIRSCGMQHFLPFLPLFLAHLIDMYTKNPFSAYIMAIDVCMRMCVSAPTAGPTLTHAVSALSEQFFTMCNSFEQFEQHPDIVEEFFFFISNAMEAVSEGFNFIFPNVAGVGLDGVPLPLPPSLICLIQGAICGLQMQHNGARTGVVHFFSELLLLVRKGQQDPKELLHPDRASYHRFASEMVSMAGFPLVQALINGLAKVGPVVLDSRRKITAGKLLMRIRDYSPQHFQDWLARSLEALPPSAQGEAKKLNLMQIIVTSSSGSFELDRTLDHFAFKCSFSFKGV